MQARLLLLLVRPSFSSAIVTLIVAGLMLTFLGGAYFFQSHFFSDYFFSLETSQVALEQASGNIDGIFEALTTGEVANTALIFIVSVVIGLGLYGGMQFAMHALGNAAGKVADIQQAQGSSVKHELEVDTGQRITIRILMLLIWLAYWFAWIKVVVPFCLLTARFGIDMLPDIAGMGYCVLSFLLLAASLHLHVICARLFAVRPRLFGGRTAIDATLID